MVELIKLWLDALRFLSFIVFFALGVAVLRAREAQARHFRLNVFVVYLLVVNFAVGITQRDDWPFSPYPLMRGLWNAHFHYEAVVIVAVDQHGREWMLDPMTWSPIFPLVMQEWVRETFTKLAPDRQREAAAFLFAKAQAARAQRASGRDYIGNETLLGPFTASDWWRYRRMSQFSPEPYGGLRIYSDGWYPDERFANPRRFTRHLVYEYRQHP